MICVDVRKVATLAKSMKTSAIQAAQVALVTQWDFMPPLSVPVDSARRSEMGLARAIIRDPATARAGVILGTCSR
jgi:hypothetical protein